MGAFGDVVAHIAGLDLNREKWRPKPRSERFSTVHWTRSTSQPVPAALPGRRSWARVHVAGGSGGPDHFQPDHKGPARIGLAWVDRLAFMRRSTAALKVMIAANSSTRTRTPASPVRTCWCPTSTAARIRADRKGTLLR